MVRQGLILSLAVAAVAVTVFMVAMRDADPPAPRIHLRKEPQLFGFVRSFEGTVPDGHVEARGNTLVADAGLVRMFEYYLAAVGEKPLDAIRAEIEREIDQRLKPPASDEAKQLLARYLDYKRALVEVEKDPKTAGGSIDAIYARMETLRQVRARYFSAAEAQAMFGLSDAYDADAVARLEIGQDRSLTEAQKRERLAALDAALPPELREAREAPLKVLHVEESIARLRAGGASDDEIYRQRAAAFTPEAAARLAELDREEAAWQERIAAYRMQRERLLNAPASQADRQAQLESLRQSLFTAQEQKRLAAYDQGS